MSVSRHPIALRLERRVGGATRLLATVMCLPLVDGIFPALVLAGAMTYPFGIIETGLLIFGGSATVAVILAEMDAEPRAAVPSILALGVVIVAGAAVEAAVAPTIGSLLDMAVFRRFAGLVILAVAAKTASARIGEYLPRPAVIIALGLVASLRPAGAEWVLTTDPWLVVRAASAAGVGVTFALVVALLGPRLRGNVDLDRFRFGSAVALGMLALSVLGLMPTEAPVALGVLCVTGVFAFDPAGGDGADAAPAADAPAGDGASADDGADAPTGDGASTDDGADADPRPPGGPLSTVRESWSDEEGSRAPWL
jgi:hypothetical protein